MLSKNNKILIGCLALLLVMSVGYALFSDTITINGSATAKGDFELTTTCDEDISATQDGFVYNSGSVTNPTITCNDNVVNASATLDYPGSTKGFRIMVTNTGTIPAKLKKVVNLEDPENLFVEQGSTGTPINNSISNDDGTNSIYVELIPNSSFYEDYAVGESEYGVLDGNSFFDEQFDAVLDPGETAYFYVQMNWNSKSTTPGDPLTATLNAELIWEQITE